MGRSTMVLVAAVLALSTAASAEEDIAGNELKAIGALKAINVAQLEFRQEDGDGNGDLDYAPSVEALAKAGLIDKALGSGTRAGYRFTVTRSPTSPSFMWMATATPVKAGVTGERHFATNHRGRVLHSLTPFQDSEGCKVTGIWVRDRLAGWVQRKTLPEGPWGAALRAAAKAKSFPYGRRWRGAFSSSSGDLYFVGVRARWRDEFYVEAARFDAKRKMVRVVAGSFDDQGRVARLKVRERAFPRGFQKTLLKAKREGERLRVETQERPERSLPWARNTITVVEALFVLPRLTKLPARLSLRLLREGVLLEGPLTVTTTTSGAKQTVTLKHAQLGEVQVTVEGGAIAAFTGLGGSWKAVTLEEAQAALQKHLPQEARRSLEGARRTGNEAAAIGALKVIASSQALFREGDKDGNGELDYASDLGALGKVQLIDSVLASGTKQGFTFKVTRSSKSPEFLWMATAAPVEFGTTGKRYFATNHEGVIYHALRPFAHNDACKLSGTPLGKPLPGRPPARPKLALPTKTPAEGERRVLGLIRTIGVVQSLFREGDKEGDSVLDYAASMKELIDTDLINPEAVKACGYTVTVCQGKKAPGFTWMLVASPTKPGTTGRHFATNHEGVTFWSPKPIALDRLECKIPPGLQAVGR